MLSILDLVVWSLIAVVIPLVSGRPSSYALWAADSAIARGQGNGLDSSGKPLVSYEHGELQGALRLLFERTGNETYYDYIKAGVDHIIDSNGKVGGGYRYVLSFILRCLSTILTL